MTTMKYKKISDFARLTKTTDGAAGYDVCSTEAATIRPWQWKAISTGICVELEKGYFIAVCPRSGLAKNFGITVLNAPGVIDSDYRGEIKVILYNASNIPFEVKTGMRIAQLVLMKHESVEMTLESDLSETQRGDGGFGHTGL